MSYRDPVELSFLASKKEKASALPPEWYQEIDGKRILRLLLCVWKTRARVTPAPIRI